MEYHSGSNRVRLIWNYENDYCLNCTSRGPITNFKIVSITNFGIKNVSWDLRLSGNVCSGFQKTVRNITKFLAIKARVIDVQITWVSYSRYLITKSSIGFLLLDTLAIARKLRDKHVRGEPILIENFAIDTITPWIVWHEVQLRLINIYNKFRN